MSLISAALALLGVAAASGDASNTRISRPARRDARKEADDARRIAELEHWIDYLESALGTERRLCAHWKEEARVLAARLEAMRLAEAAREANENIRHYQVANEQMAARQASYAQQALACQPMQNPFAGLGGPCPSAVQVPMSLLANCTPSRLDGLVGRLNRE